MSSQQQSSPSTQLSHRLLLRLSLHTSRALPASIIAAHTHFLFHFSPTSKSINFMLLSVACAPCVCVCVSVHNTHRTQPQRTYTQTHTRTRPCKSTTKEKDETERTKKETFSSKHTRTHAIFQRRKTTSGSGFSVVSVRGTVPRTETGSFRRERGPGKGWKMTNKILQTTLTGETKKYGCCFQPNSPPCRPR